VTAARHLMQPADGDGSRAQQQAVQQQAPHTQKQVKTRRRSTRRLLEAAAPALSAAEAAAAAAAVEDAWRQQQQPGRGRPAGGVPEQPAGHCGSRLRGPAAPGGRPAAAAAAGRSQRLLPVRV